jgi:hypothetical protein
MGRTTSKGAQFWAHHVEQYRHGELTLREYCERHELKLSTFGRWRRRVCRNDAGTPARPAPVNIVRVDLAAAPGASPGTLEVVLGNGRCIRVTGGFDAPTLTRLITAVEQVA